MKALVEARAFLRAIRVAHSKRFENRQGPHWVTKGTRARLRFIARTPSRGRISPHDFWEAPPVHCNTSPRVALARLDERSEATLRDCFNACGVQPVPITD